MVNSILPGGLGRVESPDPRDRPYSIELRVAPPQLVVTRVTKRWPLFRTPLHQGTEGTCVGHGWRHWLEAAPIIQLKKTEEPLARSIYLEALPLDEWTQNDWGDMNFGTSVRAGWKALRARGLVGEGNSTHNVETMADFIGGKDISGKFVGGGLVIGVPWYDSFNEPTADGFLVIPATARILGGHCMATIGWDEKRGVYEGPNSWGPAWGPKKGRYKIAGEIMERLMQEGGEAWTAQEVRI